MCILETKAGSERLRATPIIAVPTTAGTGSEVTCWGTVWDAAGGVKHSLALPNLYPEAAVIDPSLMLTKPRALTVSTGLDALSHALESIWNKNTNPISQQYAVAAAREIVEVLPVLVDDLANGTLRARMAQAALFAGLAFSNTKTAIAHSISYPLTLRYDVPHGIACSFTLPMIIRSLVGRDRQCSENLEAIFGRPLAEAANFLERFLERLGVATTPEAYRIWLVLADLRSGKIVAKGTARAIATDAGSLRVYAVDEALLNQSGDRAQVFLVQFNGAERARNLSDHQFLAIARLQALALQELAVSALNLLLDLIA
jgi:phosphonate metabolism-associated iron-containing alcohol dehydrogenase